MTAGNCKISVTLICRCHFVLTLCNNSTENSPGIRPLQYVSKKTTVLSDHSVKNFGDGKTRNYLEIILGNMKRENNWNVRDFGVLSSSSQVQETESAQKRLLTLTSSFSMHISSLPSFVHCIFRDKIILI